MYTLVVSSSPEEVERQMEETREGERRIHVFIADGLIYHKLGYFKLNVLKVGILYSSDFLAILNTMSNDLFPGRLHTNI